MVLLSLSEIDLADLFRVRSCVTRRFLLATVLVTTSCTTAAQTQPDAGRLMQDQQRLQFPEPTRRAVLPRLEPQVPAESTAPDSARVRVQAIRFSGNTLFETATLAALLVDLIGQELDLAGLDVAAARVTAFYRQQGYFVAQAILPAQQITDGSVEIAVLEGRLGTLTVDNRSSLPPALTQAYLNGLQAGQPLSGPALERALLLMIDVPGTAVASTLMPGASFGTTDLDVRLTSLAPVSGRAGIDNYGNRYTGALRPGVQASIHGPLSLGDALSVQGYLSDGDYRYARLAWQLPVGSLGWQAGVAWSSMAYRLGLDFASLDAHGTADIASLYALYPLQRSRVANVSLQINLDHKRQIDRTDSLGISTERRAQVLNLGVSGDLTDGLAGGGVSTWSLAHASGRLQLDPTTSVLDALGHRTAGGYGKWLATGARQQTVDLPVRGWSVMAQASAQFADKNLDSSEKMSLGGIQGVRAYPQGEAACDDALLVNLDLRYALADGWLLSGFYDAAAGRLNHSPIEADAGNRQRLRGAGLGLGYSRSGLAVSTALAWRNGPVPLSDHDRNPRLWLNVQTYF